VEKGTVSVGAEQRLNGKITEWELEQRQDWRLLPCCGRQEKAQICRCVWQQAYVHEQGAPDYTQT